LLLNLNPYAINHKPCKMTTEKRNDEIDLIELFQKMGNGLINLANKFLNVLYTIFLFLIRRSILIGAIIIITLAFGYFQYKTSPRYYSSSLEAYSNAMSSIDMINYVNNINKLFLEDNNEGLQSKLGLDPLLLEKIKGAKAFKVIDINKDGITDLVDYHDRYLTSDSVVSHSRFVIKVEVYSQTVFPLIQTKILNYIDQNQYIKDRNTLRKEQLSALIQKLDNEISSLDSLKKSEYFTKENRTKTQAGQILVMNETETQLYHGQIMTLYREKQGFEETLTLRTDPITVIQDFSSLSVIENNLMSYFKFWGILGLVLSILLSIFIENLKGIKRIISDSRKK